MRMQDLGLTSREAVDRDSAADCVGGGGLACRSEIRAQRTKRIEHQRDRDRIRVRREFLGEFSFSMFFVLSGISLWRHKGAPSWLSWWGIATGVLGMVGMWRNVTSALVAVAAANDYLLPAWMIVFGIWLALESRKNGH